MLSQPIRDWFVTSFGEGQIPETVVDSFEEDLADTTDELLFIKPDELEDHMKALELKPKLKSKLRRAIEKLKTERTEEEKIESNQQTKLGGVSTPSSYVSPNVHNELAQSTTPPELGSSLPTPSTLSYGRTPSENSNDSSHLITVPNIRTQAAPTAQLKPDIFTHVASHDQTPAHAISGGHSLPGVLRSVPLCLPVNDQRTPMQEQTKAPTFPQDIPRQPGTYIVPTLRKEEIHGPWKTIMVVGETGCGKSTTLNSMVNYLWDVDMKDHYRFVLIPPPSSAAAQAFSVTSEVTAYHLRPPKLPYGLTIIDTPGFGDTKGLKADEQIVDKIEHAFKHDIDTLDAIFFIVRSSGRLDYQMTYVFNSVLRLFGNDLVRNLFALVTFADGAEPPVLSSLRAAKIPVQDIFELNNSAFFNGYSPDAATPLSPHMCIRPGESLPTFPIPKGVAERSHTEIFWNIGNKALSKLFQSLQKTSAVSLKLSIGTLDLRKKLQHKIIHLQAQVTNGLGKIAHVRQNIDTIKRNAIEINQSKDFVITGQKDQIYKVDTPGQNNTTCTNCKHTCHANCAYSDNKDKVNCVAMSGENCNVCHDKCHWTAHINDNFELKTRQVETKTVRDEIKKKFDKSNADLSFAEQAVIAYSNEVMEEQKKVKISIDELRESIAELNRIAMRPSVMEEEEYYDKLVQTEEAQRNPGWKERVTALKELKERARTLKQVTSHQDAEAVIFKSAMGQLDKDLADIRTILGKGGLEGAESRLQNVVGVVSGIQSKPGLASSNMVGTSNKLVAGRDPPTRGSGNSNANHSHGLNVFVSDARGNKSSILSRFFPSR